MYIVRYNGPFGYIKPWTAVRDATTYSQAFLTPSVIEGMRQKLDVGKILRHRVRSYGISQQMERTQSAGWIGSGKEMHRQQSILTRGVLIQPELTLAFDSFPDAVQASKQHICMCRNEDVLLPVPDIVEMDGDEFNLLPGVELLFGEADDAFIVGFNRFQAGEAMYGRLVVVQDAAL